MWEGENRTDAIATFVPWLNCFCIAEVSAQILFCKCVEDGCQQVAVECKLNERYHFAVGVPIGLAAAELTVEGGSSDFDVFYLNY